MPWISRRVLPLSEAFAKGLESILLGLVGLVLGLCRGELGVSYL